jgi:hypothetical protein
VSGKNRELHDAANPPESSFMGGPIQEWDKDKCILANTDSAEIDTSTGHSCRQVYYDAGYVFSCGSSFRSQGNQFVMTLHPSVRSKEEHHV